MRQTFIMLFASTRCRREQKLCLAGVCCLAPYQNEQLRCENTTDMKMLFYQLQYCFTL